MANEPTIDKAALEAAKAAFEAVVNTAPSGNPYEDSRLLRLAGTKLLAALPPTTDGVRVTGKYDEVLVPFLSLMERELHANSGKGDRPGWMAMSRQDLLLEIHHHLAKLQKATLSNDLAGVAEFAADTANMSMMLADLCGVLPASPTTSPQAPEGVRDDVLDWQITAFDTTIALAQKCGMHVDGTLGLDHLKSMRQRIEPTFSRAKIGRWLGWAQAAVVASNSGPTLDDMKEINRTASERNRT